MYSESTGSNTVLRDLHGPAALTGDARLFWRLVWHLARTDFTLRYRGSVLGYIWSVLNPLLLFGVLYVVFTEVLRIGADIPHYASLLLLNITLYTFFAEATSASLTSIVTREQLVRKLEFPRLAIPFAIVLSATFTLGFNLIVVAAYLLITGVPVSSTWLLWPVLLLLLYVLTVGVSLLLATAYVRYRDTVQIWSLFTRLAFYASPVLFPIELFPDNFKFALLLNPLAPIFAQARVWILDPAAPTYAEVMGGTIYLLIPAAILVAVVVLGFWFFNREAPKVAEEL